MHQSSFFHITCGRKKIKNIYKVKKNAGTIAVPTTTRLSTANDVAVACTNKKRNEAVGTVKLIYY